MAANWGLISYLSASLLFTFLSALVLFGRRAVADKHWKLLLPIVASAVWAGVMAWQSLDTRLSFTVVFIAEVARDIAWVFFLLSVLGGKKGDSAPKSLRIAAYLIAVLVPLAGLWPSPNFLGLDTVSVFVFGSLVFALLGLMLTEQVFRNAAPEHRKALSYLCVAIGAIFAYDLFMFSSGVLVDQIDPTLLETRGIANALIVPLLAVFVRRHADWKVDIFVSRHVVFFGATLLGAGVYLVLMATAGFYVRRIGGDWGATLQVVFFFGAAVLLGTILLSGRLRRSANVFLSKHFYKNKYDYRQEWLRLIETISNPEDSNDLNIRSIRAIAQIVGAESGTLWLHEYKNRMYQPATTWNRDAPGVVGESDDTEFIRFLYETGWVIGYAAEDDRPNPRQPALPDWLTSEADRKLLVPLMLRTDLYGFVVVDKPQAKLKLTYEDTDLLKTAGKQIAGSISLQNVNERLAQQRQFQAFNRLTAFMMHDLKNLIAQLSLVVRNAATHENNPEFFSDAMDTISGSVERMNRMIAQLKEQSRQNILESVDLAELIDAVCAATSDRSPTPEIGLISDSAIITADPDRMHSILIHLIRNAQDACEPGDSIEVDLSMKGHMLVLTIEDDGAGMDQQFVKTRLFRPFDSTKGSKGMGIGAYQVREYVHELGGRVSVDSEPGRGTIFSMYLPGEDASPAGELIERS